MKKTRKQLLYENSQRNRRVAYNSYIYGWPIDLEKQQQIAEKLNRIITECDEKLAAVLYRLRQSAETPEERRKLEKFSPGSSQQVAWLFYEFLDEPIVHRTNQGAPSAGAAARESISRHGQPDAKEIAKILDARAKAAKLVDAYIKNLSGVAMVRPSAHVTAQVAGRWSYRDPALQTVPPIIRPMFVAHPGCWLMLCDLAGAEYRSMALQAGCTPMLEAFAADGDLHKNTASVLFGVPENEVTPKQRKIAKGVGLGFHYSVLDIESAAAGLYAQVGHLSPGLTFEMMLGALRRLAKARPEIMEFKRRTWESAKERDYVEEPVNRRRRYFYGKPKDTESFNFAQQAMIAAVVDRAIQAVDNEFEQGEGLHLQRHDELILGGPNPHRLADLLWRHFRQAYEIDGHRVLFEIEYTLTRRWGSGVDVAPKKLGTEFHVGCRSGCDYNVAHGNLHDAVTDAAKHYDACEKTEK